MYQTVTIAELRLQYELENALKPASLLAGLFGDDDDDVVDHLGACSRCGVPGTPEHSYIIECADAQIAYYKSPFPCAIADRPRGGKRCAQQCQSCAILFR